MPSPFPTVPAIAATLLAVLLAGCASTAAPKIALFQPSKPEGYQLSKAELGYDCAKLTGHMRVRITTIRGTADRERTTVASRAMHQAITSTGAGSDRGADPKVDLARDREMLNAYNGQLAAKTCKPLDIDAELAGQPTPDGGKPIKAAAPAAKK